MGYERLNDLMLSAVTSRLQGRNAAGSCPRTDEVSEAFNRTANMASKRSR